MSCDWYIKCVDCNETHSFDGTNHQDELMLKILRHREAIATLVELFDEINAHLSVDGFQRWQLDPQVVPQASQLSALARRRIRPCVEPMPSVGRMRRWASAPLRARKQARRSVQAGEATKKRYLKRRPFSAPRRKRYPANLLSLCRIKSPRTPSHRHNMMQDNEDFDDQPTVVHARAPDGTWQTLNTYATPEAFDAAVADFDKLTIETPPRRLARGTQKQEGNR